MIRKILDDYNIKDFSLSEVTRGQDNIPEEYHNNIIPTLCVLQRIRTIIAEPVIIRSTYRNPEHNIRAGGSPGSLHLVFNAIDFTPLNYDSFSLMILYCRIYRGSFAIDIPFNGKRVKVTPGVMGLGLYRTFIHIDTRGLLGRKAPAQWFG